MRDHPPPDVTGTHDHVDGERLRGPARSSTAAGASPAARSRAASAVMYVHTSGMSR
ncbi:hypothetical protein [Micromonospora chalcea]|uniref:hypothetical protein n=1 Tax=Micromonospora chalcea TaxID=1874 RepID=UPI003D731F54